MGKVVARVFPRRTKATPDDSLAFAAGPGLFPPEVDEVHISVAFTWDLSRAEWLEKQWKHIAPVTISGPATGVRGEGFTPGMYLKPGYIITSRGCPNRCWFCSVWKRDGQVRELPIESGWNVLDDNLLACSRGHIEHVFAMLKEQRHRPEFTGGLEAAKLQPWMAEAIWSLRPQQTFFAYDTPDDWEPLMRAVDLCWRAGFSRKGRRIRAYVLCGWPKDTIAAAQDRIWRVLGIGVVPMAMLWRDDSGKRDANWIHFAKLWSRPASIMAMERARRNGRG